MVIRTMGFLRLALHMLLSLMASAYFGGGHVANGADVPVQLNDDVLGLIVFKSDLSDPSSYLGSWSEDDTSPCSWRYVQCDPVTGQVTEVSLDGLGLSGKVGRGLEKLDHLKVLSLSCNNFTGSVGPQLALPSGLQRLNLSRNGLSGRFPTSLLNMSSIRFLDLSENSFSGPLPDGLFGGCSSLHLVSFAGNMLEGPIPSSLAQCIFLNSLNLSSNRFSGDPNFAMAIWTLQRLRVLDLSNNMLSGPIPAGVSAVHNLKVLLLGGNRLTGQLPGDVGLCPHLTALDFQDNLLTGPLPWSLRNLYSLVSLSLANNMLTGDFPNWIGNMTSLQYLDFSSNKFAGSIPTSVRNLQSLRYLSLSDNGLSGNIPLSLAYCSKLTVIRLRDNSITGSVPGELFDLGLQEVDFSNNKLVGPVPPGSSRLFQSLHTLDLSRNNLSGDIPAEMGLLSNLRYLNLSWNGLSSRMSPELGYFQNLTVLDFRNNDLYGSIPGDICDAGSLAILQLDGNALIGPIPDEIGNCSSLHLLSLSHNNLSGPIPQSISMLSNLKILKLEFNELSGELPQELGKLEDLLAVNVSYNRLTGRLPAGGIFPSLDQSAIQGNLGICSPILKGPCVMNAPKPLVLDPYAYGNGPRDGHRHRHEGSSHNHMFLSVSAIVAISAAFLIACGVIVISLLNVSARRRLAFIDTALESMCSSSSRSGSLAMGKLILFDSKVCPEISLSNPQSLLNKASEIGEGVFGTVFKVPLGTQGRMVAVKRLVTSNTIQYQEDFDREVRVLGGARHPNLIELVGYWWTPQLQLIVTEYASNGSLHSKLHQRLPSSPPLSWATRFKIMLGVAKGLAHLHHSFHPPIIHYNIKPSNILLDESNNPKISDFGLARLLTKLDRHVMNNRFQSAPGYVAPELTCQSLRVNEKCDVYGFGILIFELVTGRRPVEYGEDNVMILSEHVRVLLEHGNVLDCVDLSMAEYPEDEVLPVLKLALVCTSQVPSSRPSMAEVVHILQMIKTPVPHRMEPY
ncbi:probably inactive leucine-rich repeat receptor-like protein kinase At3g28040 [Rhodamnia argentea]|uniref:non-specific serine/threonine protein kinase n=1 Tax=Rhodamnia argentea TaxID=178133 RepID=A0A8B8R1D6_9MYRT|nr:probably inactive leucine-rich repeat receptor-like protein kinase At3g28040 [Rhodamnia argentea]XP_048135664.1 probably inactive leucine-rich repeat receptor-like protein kinase At3g28040 [Rhodamnia argentea]